MAIDTESGLAAGESRAGQANGSGRPGFVSPQQMEAWLADLGLRPLERAEREGVASWDLRLDGRRRTGVRVTLILEPSLGAIIWLHFAPAINDGLRASYRRLLRWNDELPFAKFSLAEDGRPILSAEIPTVQLSRDELGRGLARLLAICDSLLDETTGWLWPGGRGTLPPVSSGAGVALLERYPEAVAEVAASGEGVDR